MAAVTLAYREWADPAGEISLATPSAGLKLVALRALVVSLAAVPFAFLVLLAVDRGPGTCRSGWAPPGACRAWPWPPWSCSLVPPAWTRSSWRSGSVRPGPCSVLAVVTVGRRPAPRAVPRPHRHPGRADRGPRGPRRRCLAHRRPPGRRHLPEVRMTTTASTVTGSAIEVTAPREEVRPQPGRRRRQPRRRPWRDRPARPERRREDHAAADARHGARPRRGELRLLGLRPGRPARARWRSAASRLPAAVTRPVPRLHAVRHGRLRRRAQGAHRPGLAPAPRSGESWSRWGSTT